MLNNGRPSQWARASVAAAALALSACLSPQPDSFLAVAHKNRPAVDVFYVTNRAPVTHENGAHSYGAGRSHSLAFGSVTVAGHEAAEAVVAEPQEIGRFPATPYDIEPAPGGMRRASETIAAHEQSLAQLQAELQRRVAASRRKEVVVFIHGYNNSFDDAAKSTGQICNDLGPEDFTCVALTWPAGGSKGILFGYNVDRESGEFAVIDVRKSIRMIAGTPGLQKIHFLAHSRGTDVLTSALQHLNIESYVAQGSLWSRLRIANIILAAPDIDIDVALSRLLGVPSDPDMPFGAAPLRSKVFKSGALHFTIYSSLSDRALRMSTFLFGSALRLGMLDAHSEPDEMRMLPHVAGAADFIGVQGGGGLIGHSYFLSDPAVRSDLVALIRDSKKPGEEGRPMQEVSKPFWFLPDRPSGAQ
ncbi:MAG: alpha/beta hydrolase [Methylocystis sp.]|uniref:alpha/beta hydrolase n=1 Tax=Methylocystis sp. TaxID=1911079 RepID=UPI003DA2D9DE